MDDENLIRDKLRTRFAEEHPGPFDPEKFTKWLEDKLYGVWTGLNEVMDFYQNGALNVNLLEVRNLIL